MAQTPDHRPGIPGYEDTEQQFEDVGTTFPSIAGAQAYGNGRFRFKDALGTYDPRTVYTQTHTTLADLAHVATNGPAGVNAYRTKVYVTGTIFTQAVIWWTDSTQTSRFWDLTYTWGAGNYVTPTKIVWQMYAPGTTVLYRITDSLVLSGTTEVARQRTYTQGP